MKFLKKFQKSSTFWIHEYIHVDALCTIVAEISRCCSPSALLSQSLTLFWRKSRPEILIVRRLRSWYRDNYIWDSTHPNICFVECEDAMSWMNGDFCWWLWHFLKLIIDRTGVNACYLDWRTNQPTDRPTDRPIVRPTDRSTDQPTDPPTDRTNAPPTDPPTYRPTHRPTHRLTHRRTDDWIMNFS